MLLCDIVSSKKLFFELFPFEKSFRLSQQHILNIPEHSLKKKTDTLNGGHI